MEENPESIQKPGKTSAEETNVPADAWLPAEGAEEAQEPVKEQVVAESVDERNVEVIESAAGNTKETVEGVIVDVEETAESRVAEVVGVVDSAVVGETLAAQEIPAAAAGDGPEMVETPIKPEILDASYKAPPPNKNSNGWVIALVLLLVLCCCCVVTIWFGIFFARVLGGAFVWLYDLVIDILNSIFGGVIQFY